MPAAGPAFEATGYVTYTRFDLAGQPDGKSMRLFVANVVGSDWHIRTEPGILGPDTMAFGEATATSEQEVVMLLGLPSPEVNSHPALAHLRHELEAARHSHLVFVNPPIPPLPEPYAALVSPFDSTPPESTGAGPADQRGPDHGVLATATVLRGNTPRAEGMHVSLIRFALTPPAAPAVGQAGMLPQVWDDGNREVIFREATWEVFPTAPHLVASAVNQTPPRRDVVDLILKKSKQLLGDVTPLVRQTLTRVSPHARLLKMHAEATPQIPSDSVSLVVTSPPFLDVVDYATDNWLRCWFAGIDAKSVTLTTPGRLDVWATTMTGVFRELERVVKPGGHVAFEVGEVHGGKTKLEETALPCGVAAGFEPVLVLINDQEFTKTANCWGVKNNHKGTNTNRVVVFRKAR